MSQRSDRSMKLDDSLRPVLDAAGAAAADVDAKARFPHEAVGALRGSGLLGLTLPVDVGGCGGGPAELVEVTGRLAGACGSTAMVYLMHVSGSMAVAAAPPPGQPELLKRLAGGQVLATLALSEAASRSHFRAPVSQGETVAGGVRLTVRKSFVTSAGHADLYVVSTRTPRDQAPADQPGASDLFVVDATARGVAVAGPWRGLGLRGNASAPMTFDLVVPDADRLGEPGAGFGLKLSAVMPWFNLGNAAVSVGLAQAALDATIRHTGGARLEHLGECLAGLPTIRAQLARAALDLAATRAYVDVAAASLATPDDATTLHVLGVKALANDAALRVTDAAMRMCGGAAFADHLAIERYFRDARAGHVMAPTADVLYDFYGKAITGQPLF
jgi:alkylation response protein AidB-like acyl-CoA dehydrogenase